jgi:hypothetical protein
MEKTATRTNRMGNPIARYSRSIRIMLRQAVVAEMIIVLWGVAVSRVHAQLEFGTPDRMGSNVNEERHGESDPSLSYDGLELFFADIPDGTLYSARRENRDGEFGPRQAIGSGKNPSISADGLSLYFTSGGLWVMTRDDVDSAWDRDGAQRVAYDFWIERPPRWMVEPTGHFRRWTGTLLHIRGPQSRLHLADEPRDRR